MKRQKISQVIGNLDEKIITEATDFQKKSKPQRWIRWVAAAACLCILITGAALYMGTAGPGHDPTDHTGGGKIVADPTGLNIWTYQGKYANTVTFRKLSKSNIQTELNITTATDDRYLIEEDACAVLFGQYLSLLHDFDYENHFKMYPQALVQSKFVAKLEQRGLTYGQGMANIEETVSKVVGFNECSFSYTLDRFDSIFPKSEGYADLFDGYEGWFADAGVDISEIGEVRVYYFTDLKRTFGGQYAEYDALSGLDLERGFYFYHHEGQWNLWPTTIDDDLSVDLAQSRDGHGYLEVFQESGTIEAIEGEYIKLSGHRGRFLAPDDAPAYSIGDQVCISYYKSFGITLKLDADGTKIEIYRACSVTAEN